MRTIPLMLIAAVALAGCTFNTPDEVSVTPGEEENGTVTEGNTTAVDTPDQVTIGADEEEGDEQAQV